MTLCTDLADNLLEGSDLGLKITAADMPALLQPGDARRHESTGPVLHQAKLSAIRALNHWFIWLKFLLLQPTDAAELAATAAIWPVVPLY